MDVGIDGAKNEGAHATIRKNSLYGGIVQKT
jgi:hypothetical protein